MPGSFGTGLTEAGGSSAVAEDGSGKAHAQWISTVVEDVLEPELPILDPHPVSYTHLTLPTRDLV